MGDPDNWTHDKLNELRANPEPLLVDIDTDTPHVARIYDYVLGGKQNFIVDRQAWWKLASQFPGIGVMAKANREFLQRAVHYLATEAGIDQFIDVGSGLPTVQNVHEMAHLVNPAAKVVYVDIDPIVLAHGRALLADDDTTIVIQADGADPASILDHPDTQRLIDFDRPWALIMCYFLHHLTDEQNPVGVVDAFKARMVPGCYFASSNLLADDHERAGDVAQAAMKQIGTGYARPWDTHRQYFTGLELVEPGLVYLGDWRPYLDTVRDDEWATLVTAGVGRKP